jgi:hypothetical protein
MRDIRVWTTRDTNRMPGVKFIIFFKYKLTATFFKLITSNLYFLIKTIINAVI